MAEITYFENAGVENTAEVIALALARFKKGGIDRIVIASTYGETAMAAAKSFAGCGARLLIFGEVIDGVQHPAGDVCQALAKQGHQVIWGVHLNAMSVFTGDHSARLVSEAYYRVSEGFKVACEIVLIATSQGYLQPGDQVLAIAGTHRGADTAIVASAGAITQFKDFEVHELLCKPYRRSNL